MFMKFKSSSPVPWQKIFFRKEYLWKGMLFSDNTFILFGCRLLVCIENWSYTSCQNGQFAFPSQGVIYGDCMLLVKKANVNLKNKQDPNPSTYFLYKDSNVFNGFHLYSQYIDYFSIYCVPQLAKKGDGVVVSDSHHNRYCMQIKHLDINKKDHKNVGITMKKF